MTALTDGLHDVPPGKLATVVTYLDMTAKLPAASPVLPDGVAITPVPAPDVDWYLALFRRVGAPWLWFDRLGDTAAELNATLRDPACLILKMAHGGVDIGFAELDFRTPGTVEIVYFGLVPEATGGGLGAKLMSAALDAAWRPDVRRVWLHTCDFDDPRALGFYRRMGFAPYDRKVEVTDDPRLVGLLRRDAASHVPLLGQRADGDVIG